MNNNSDPAAEAGLPKGVWLLTIFGILFAGVFPLIGIILKYQDASHAVTIQSIMISFIMSILIIVSGINTLRGKEKGMKFFLTIVSIYYLIIIGANAYYLITHDLDALAQRKLTANIVRSIFWIAVFNWYFRKKDIKEYFAKQAGKF
jgi:glucan phosphoethanolaminetransferase (alkaline phosphatase superfamily)